MAMSSGDDSGFVHNNSAFISEATISKLLLITEPSRTVPLIVPVILLKLSS
jgi:hypothetical protein